jgi:1L-myo-inositol 1-phosphate cytidylyltransferase
MSGTARSDRTGLILAAGYGTRHAVGDDAILKPLLPVAGRALILRAIDNLVLARCSRVVIVLGYEANRIREHIDRSYAGQGEITFVINERFELQNGMSVLAARDAVGGEFVLAMADHVFEPSVMHLVARNSCPAEGSTLIVDSKLDAVSDLEDATKVEVRGGRIVRIGKTLQHFNAVDCGVFLAGPALLQSLDEVARTKGDASVSDGVQRLADDGRMVALDLGAARWEDVDTPEMLTAAERLLTNEPPNQRP